MIVHFLPTLLLVLSYLSKQLLILLFTSKAKLPSSLAFTACHKKRSYANSNNIKFTTKPFLSSTASTNIHEKQVPYQSNQAILNISYDGRHFHGWSSANDDKEFLQPNSEEVIDVTTTEINRNRRYKKQFQRYSTSPRSVQGIIQKQLSQLYGNIPKEHVIVTGCSRTDKGVHATSQIASFHALSSQNSTLPLPFEANYSKIQYCLNRMLPKDVKITAIAPVPHDEFHATKCAKSKTYQYTFSTGAQHDPLSYRTTWHVDTKNEFNLQAAQKCCQLFLGTHNFMAFMGALRGSDRKNKHKIKPYCHIESINIDRVKDTSISSLHSYFSIENFVVRIKGSRFLYKMVRFLVGTCVAVGCGKISVENVQQALESGERDGNVWNYAMCAPPHGLVLIDVDYGYELDWI